MCIRDSNYPNQGFRIGAAAWGVQFHLEVTPAAVDGFLREFGADAVSYTHLDVYKRQPTWCRVPPSS